MNVGTRSGSQTSEPDQRPHEEKGPQLGNPLSEGKPGLAGESGVLGPEPGGQSLQGLVGTSATVWVEAVASAAGGWLQHGWPLAPALWGSCIAPGSSAYRQGQTLPG